LISCSFLDVLLNEANYLLCLGRGREKLNHFARRVDKKFGKIPRNNLSCACLRVVKRAVVSEIDEERVGFISIDFDLLQNREFDIEIFCHKILNFLRRSTFLSEELIAREGQNFKAAVSPTFMSFDHLLVVVASKSSLACHIDNHD